MRKGVVLGLLLSSCATELTYDALHGRPNDFVVPPLDGGGDASPGAVSPADGGGGAASACDTQIVLPRLPVPVFLSTAVGRPDGTVYLVSGGDPFGLSLLTTVWAYDPKQNSWRTIAPLPATPKVPVAASAAAQIFVRDESTLWDYDPTSDRWSSTAPPPSYRTGAAAATGLDGRIYLFGGMDAQGNTLISGESYDPANDRWSTLPPLPFYETGLGAATTPDGKIYVVGKSAAVYDPVAQRWSNLPSATTPRSWGGVATSSAATATTS
jgi:N-acetylneuraminic acid mutarotase